MFNANLLCDIAALALTSAFLIESTTYCRFISNSRAVGTPPIIVVCLLTLTAISVSAACLVFINSSFGPSTTIALAPPRTLIKS